MTDDVEETLLWSDDDVEVAEHGNETDESDESDSGEASVSLSCAEESEDEDAEDDDAEEENADTERKCFTQTSCYYKRGKNKIARPSIRDTVYVQLFRDSVFGEFFLIDGDSLLLYAMETESWQLPQQLHLFYVIELFLERFRVQKQDYQFVFFTDYELLWSHSPEMSVLRLALIMHLQYNCRREVHASWRNPFDSAFLAFLADQDPYFMMIHDGVGLRGDLLPKDLCDYLSRAAGLLMLSVHLHTQVVFISSVRQEDLNLFALHLDKVPCHARPQQAMKILESLWNPIVVKGQDFPRSCGAGVPIGATVECPYTFLALHVLSMTDGKEIGFKIGSYFAAMKHLTMHQRVLLARRYFHSAQDVSSVKNRAFFNEKFLKALLDALQAIRSRAEEFQSKVFLADLLDIAVYAETFDAVGPVSWFQNHDVIRNVHDFLVKLNLKTDKSCPLSPAEDLDFTVTSAPAVAATTSPLAHAFAKEILDDLNTLDAKDMKILDLLSGSDFDERYHWHSMKPLLDDVDLHTEEQSNGFYANKQRQLFASNVNLYGKTLCGSAPPIFIPQSGSGRKARKEKKAPHTLKGKQHKNKQTLTKEEIIQKNVRSKQEDARARASDQWRLCEKAIKPLEQKEALESVDDFLKKFGMFSLFEPAVRKKMDLMLSLWRAKQDKGLCVELVAFLQELTSSEDRISTMTKETKTMIVQTFLRLGFGEIKTHLCDLLSCNVETDQGLYKSDMSYNSFQLQFMGPRLPRSDRRDPDPRVTGFIPDTWQRALLDVIDRNESALIVAPTSSGKTFCSYYCIERVLRESDTGIVVYVSPTKALVNQVHASISARFDKQYAKGRTLCGIFTREYAHDLMSCQVLVTVPQCLELLVLSPRRQEWVSRLRYVIFDEVHCLDSEIGGVIWEHLLTMIPCPFLALSATIGNFDVLHKWLAGVEQFRKSLQLSSPRSSSPARSYEVSLIKYDERYSDIEVSIYMPRSRRICHIHPWTLLLASRVATGEFPSSVALSPSEVYHAWLAACKVFDADPAAKASLQRLNPDTYFGTCVAIPRSRIREYEGCLKSTLSSLFRGSIAAVESYIKQLQAITGFDQVEKDLEFRPDKFFSDFPVLVELLKLAGWLPVLAFMNNREGTVKLCKAVFAKVQGDLSGRLRGAKLDGASSLQAAVCKSKKKQRDRKEKRDPDEENHLEATHAAKELAVDALKRKVRYVDLSKNVDGDLMVFLGRASRTMSELLELGIGYHHAGCASKDKRAVEVFFRAGLAQVVAATQTLALGIHMPCKTVVFAGDDKYLDSLSFRQMSGRSGRRGFDNVGHAVFYGVRMERIKHLINADLSELKGHFPISCSFVLQLLLLTSNTADEYKNDAMNRALVALNMPFVVQQRPGLREEIKIFFVFCIDLLLKLKLIDVAGKPQGFAGLVTHLHYQEPGNLILVFLLQSGVLHQICRPANSKSNLRSCSEDVLRELVLILCHIFTRKELPRGWKAGAQRYGSVVLLSPLPKKVAQAVSLFNEQVRDIFSNHLKCVAQRKHFSEAKLPLSNLKFLVGDRSSLTASSVASPFAQLSGVSEIRVNDPDKLFGVMRDDLFLDTRFIPLCPDGARLNAYALDFFKHGSRKALRLDNGIRESEMYNDLQDFMLITKAVASSLKQLGPSVDDDCVVDAFHRLSIEYGSRFDKAFPRDR